MNTYANGNSAANLNNMLQQALSFHQQGKLDKAEELYNAILAIDPNHSAALHYLGVIFDVNGDYLKAIELIEKSVKINPNDPEAFNNLGLAYKAKDEWMKAVTYYKHAIKLDPNYPEAMYNLSIALHHAEMYEEALDFFNKTLKLRPDYAEVYCSMGRTYSALGKPQQEIESCQKALDIKPTLAEAYINMGVSYAELDNMEEAETCFRKCVDINPNYTVALFNLSVMLEEQGKTQEAETIYRTVLSKQPDFQAALHNISSVLQQQGKVEDARNQFKQALSVQSSDEIKIKLALVGSPIFASKDAIIAERDMTERDVEALMQESLTLNNPYFQVGTINFYHAFHGLNNRHLNSVVSRMFLKACPELEYVAPHIATPRNPNDLIRIGIFSAFFKEHTITKFMHGIVEKLPRDQFEVVLIAVQGAEDSMTHAIKSVSDFVVSIPKDLDKARKEIQHHALDILFYSDIGMESFTTFLAYSRLARVQCVTWGHPDTSAIPNIDYFISQKDIETPSSQDAYTEQLICLNELPTYYYPPAMPTLRTKENFKLPEDKRIYLCPQSLFKFHPDFDEILGSILRKDTDSVLVLIEGHHRYWKTLLTERFTNTIPDVVDRIIFVPRLSKENFLALLLLSDAVLDPIHFGGGNTSYESFALGVPIVTLPGEFMRGRVTYGCYKKMDMFDLVAKDKAQYIELVLKLANDPAFKQQMVQKIKQKSSVLYKNDAVITELSDFFTKAMNAQQRGEKLNAWPV